MRILVLTPDLAQGGGVTNYYNALRLNEQNGIEYFFVNKCNTKSIVSKIYSAIFIYMRFIYKILKIDLIHINPSLNSKSFYRDMVFIIVARVFRKRILVFFRGWEDEYQASVLKSTAKLFLFRHTYAKANRYIVLSKTFKEKLQILGVGTAVPFDIETTVADSSNIENFSVKNKITSRKNAINCLFISRILKEKGVYIALDAFDKCQKKMKRILITMTVAGDGDELNAVKDYVKQQNIQNVKFTGYVSGSDKLKLLESSHIMVFPTYYSEGLPNSVLEGMLYGMPIISRINAGIPDIVEHDINGYLTDSLDSEVFSDYLCALIDNEDNFNRMVTENHIKAMQNFTIDKVKGRILAIYADMLKGESLADNTQQ